MQKSIIVRLVQVTTCISGVVCLQTLTDTQRWLRELLKLATSLLIVSTRIDGGDRYGSKDTWTIEKSS